MPHPFTLFTGQRADLPLEEVGRFGAGQRRAGELADSRGDAKGRLLSILGHREADGGCGSVTSGLADPGR